MVQERQQQFNFGFYMANPEFNRKTRYVVNTRFGKQDFGIEQVPNNYAGRRSMINTLLQSARKASGEVGNVVDINTIRGFIAEGWAGDILSDIFPMCHVVPAPSEFEESMRKNQKGGDILILEKDGDAFSTVLMVDVTTRRTTGLGKKKKAGINAELMAPVISLPLGDFFVPPQEYGSFSRAKDHFDETVLPSILMKSYDPYIGIDDPELFLDSVAECLLDIVRSSSLNLFVTLHKAHEYFIHPHEEAIKKLGRVRSLLSD